MPIRPQKRTDQGETTDAAGRLTPLRELQLVQAHRRGDADAMSELLRSYERRIYSVCYRMVRDEHDARDLAQDAMVKLLQGLDSYDGRAKLSTWVIRISLNCCLSHLRKQRLRRHGSIDRDWPQGAGGPVLAAGAGRELLPTGGVERTEMQNILSRALGSLDPQMRAVLVLRDMQDLEYSQIAGVLDIPVGTVKSRLFRARMALRTAVEAQESKGGAEH
ncbi:MAG: RNA polymerase sigma factor [Planctomycetota bacterium]|jgi:RNA polymerase sigma-70 factor (ECF subfamily)